MRLNKGVFLGATVCLCLAGACHAQEAPKITETETFFKEYFAVEYPSQTEFETEEQYKARHPLWTRGEVFLVVEPLHNPDPSHTTGEYVLDKPYRYDLKSKKLTIRGGGQGPVLKSVLRDVADAAIGVHSTLEQLEPYDAQNGFGAKTFVKPYRLTQYFIHGRKVDQLPVDHYNNLSFDIPNLPADEAQAQATDYNIIVGFTPQNYEKRRLATFTLAKPTVSNPIKLDVNLFIVEVDIQEVLFQRKSTGEIVKRVVVKK